MGKIKLLVMGGACVCVGLLWLSNSEAKENYGDVKVDQILRVYDGDTFYANIKGWPPIAGKSIGIRINGVDTPEIRGSKCALEKKKAYEARGFLRRRLLRAKEVELRNIQRGKYFRVVADVYADGVNIAQQLIGANLGYPYFGKTKKGWCG